MHSASCSFYTCVSPLLHGLAAVPGERLCSVGFLNAQAHKRLEHTMVQTDDHVSPDNVHFGLVHVWSHCTQGPVLESADKCKQQSRGKLYLEIHRQSMLPLQCLQQTTARQVGVDSKTLFWSVGVLPEPVKKTKKGGFQSASPVSHCRFAKLTPSLKQPRCQLHFPLSAGQLLPG